MHDLVQVLRAEHDDLRLAVGVLAAMADRVAAGCPFPDADCARALLFLQDFAIGVHFQKEGLTLLPATAMFGSAQDAQAAGAVLRSQALFQELLHTLVLFWEPGGGLTDAERMEWPGRFAAIEHGRRSRADWHRELADLTARWSSC
jgi:hypothetical protein